MITVKGSDPVEIEVGTNYTDEGASATDNIDGDLTGSIVFGGSVDTNTEGSYELTYTVSDSAGNTAVASRYVNVIVPPEPEPTVAESVPNEPTS